MPGDLLPELEASLSGAFTNAFQSIDDASDQLSPSASVDIGVQAFCRDWFNHDDATFVVFSKNVVVTNIQFAEFVSLVGLYANYPDNCKVAWQFQTARQMKQNLREILSIHWENDSAEFRAKRLTELYLTFFARVLLLDDFHGSAILTAPNLVSLDRHAVCKDSGYVHSIGQLLLSTDIQTTTSEQIVSTVENRMRSCDGKRALCVLSHEGHDPFDRQYASQLRFGIDDLKLHADKLKFGGHTLRRVLADLKKQCPDLIISHTNEPLSLDYANDDRVIWMVTDCDAEYSVQDRNSTAAVTSSCMNSSFETGIRYVSSTRGNPVGSTRTRCLTISPQRCST